MWGDAATERIIRIECTYNGVPKTEIVKSDFEFDVPLEASLFSLDPPRITRRRRSPSMPLLPRSRISLRPCDA